MKKIKYILLGLCSAFVLTGCLDDFRELNTDTEKLGNADPINVFTGATENFNNNSRAHLTNKYSGVMTYMQYLVSSGGASTKTYNTLSSDKGRTEPYSPSYDDYYGRYGLRLDYLIKNVIPVQNKPEKYADIGAISQILLNYEQWRILDTYGAAPITEAFKKQTEEKIDNPRYDLYQEGIDGTPMYEKIDAEVKNAIETLKKSDSEQSKLGVNDFFYGGDVAKWIKFGNTLRVKMAQRLKKMDNNFYERVISEVLTSSPDIISNNEESCIYYHSNDYNNNSDDIQDITSRYCASAAFVNFLKAYDDPRLPILVRKNGFGYGNNNEINDGWFDTLKTQYSDYETRYAQFIDRYVGMSANPDSASTTYHKNAYLTLPYTKDTVHNLDIRINSQIESRYYVKNGGRNGNNNMPAREIEESKYEINQDNMGTYTPIITYPETCFMLAEIALDKGAVAGKDATAWFREGIKASMEQYAAWAKKMYVVAQVSKDSINSNPLTDAKIEAYLARPEFQTATLEKIISQQWINLYMQPEEMWATWKRTGLPKFKGKPIPEDGVAFLEVISKDGEPLHIPRRNSLPTPNTQNLDNYKSAIEKLKQDAKYGIDNDRTEGRIWWDKE